MMRVEEVREIIESVKTTHHAYLYRELPLLVNLLKELSLRYAVHDPRALFLSNLFARFARDFMAHMKTEEVLVFPFLEKTFEAGDLRKALVDRTMAKQLQKIDLEDRIVGAGLERVHQLTLEMCRNIDDARYRDVLRRLEKMISDCKIHVQKENHQLYSALQFLRTNAEQSEETTF